MRHCSSAYGFVLCVRWKLNCFLSLQAIRLLGHINDGGEATQKGLVEGINALTKTSKLSINISEVIFHAHVE